MPESELYADLDACIATAAAPHWVAYSGGLDSTTLLHALCARLGAERVQAIHVHHGLSAQADQWVEHCTAQCQQLGVALTIARAEVTNAGQGLEAAARRERYRHFDSALAGGGTLWLAHHLDDQLETFMLRLLRGSGLNGLGAMAAQRDQADYQLLRPWLARPRSQLEAYAAQHQLRCCAA